MNFIEIKKIIIAVLIIFPIYTFSQEHQEDNNQIESDENHGKIRIAGSLSQTHISSHHYHENEDYPSQLIPTDGIEIQYFISKNLSIKWTNEIEFASYILKAENGLSKVRKNAFLSAAILGYEIYNFGLFVGMGYEFEENEHLLVQRFGIEYIIELNENVDISPAYIFDSMGPSHTSHSLAIAIGYHF